MVWVDHHELTRTLFLNTPEMTKVISVFVTFSKNVSAEVSYRMYLAKGNTKPSSSKTRRPRFSFFIFNCQRTKTHRILSNQIKFAHANEYQFKVGFR